MSMYIFLPTLHNGKCIYYSNNVTIIICFPEIYLIIFLLPTSTTQLNNSAANLKKKKLGSILYGRLTVTRTVLCYEVFGLEEPCLI